jgi:DNA-nicking Smr family endonuclease
MILNIFKNSFLAMSEKDDQEYHHVPITGILDLHLFSPKDLSTLIDEYIDACLEKEIYQVRFIHGKGIGNIRRSVHALLERNPHVTGFQLANESGGGWGATIANLSPDSKA